ncbi:DUF6777 domain-containing protein [Streptomyces sp. NPDC004561]
MRIPPGSIVAACVLSVALLLAGCAGTAVKEAQLGEEVFLQPSAAQGPDPFTDSTATGPTATATRPTAGDRTADISAPPAGLAVAPLAAARTLSGETPGLYSGSAHVAGCDAERQIGRLAADRARGEAFAHAVGVSRPALPGYLRGLTPVLLRADTRVTNHGYRGGRVTGYQAVLQAGTAVLVDNRGVPRVRCACGNPLRPPEESRGGVGARGTAWSGYRPNQVIVVAPAPKTVRSLTLVDVRTNTWIERRIGLDVGKDHVVAPPVRSTTAPPDAALTVPTHLPPPGTGQPNAPTNRPGVAAGETGGGSPDATRPAQAPTTGCAPPALPQPAGPAACPMAPSVAGDRGGAANSARGSGSGPGSGSGSGSSSGSGPGSASGSGSGTGSASGSGSGSGFDAGSAEQRTPLSGTALPQDPSALGPAPATPGEIGSTGAADTPGEIGPTAAADTPAEVGPTRAADTPGQVGPTGSPDTRDDIGPRSVPETPDPRDFEGLIPDSPPDSPPGSSGASDSVPDSPAGAVDG